MNNRRFLQALENEDTTPETFLGVYLAQCKRKEIKPSRAAQRELRRIHKESNIVDLKAYKRIPRYGFDEVETGCLLGKGNYSNVYEVKSIQRQGSACREECRYAMKYLKKKVTERPALFLKAAVDFIHEAALLSSLDHPNIIKIRGMSRNGSAGFRTQPVGGYFIMMDRLDETLQDRIDVWRTMQEDVKAAFSTDMFSISNHKTSKEVKREFLASRLTVAVHTARALQYLHGNRIVYRDLKPENIGFDAQGNLKLFDFGAACELPQDLNLNAEYNLPGGVGTPRYMAPEVSLHKPYNCTADVYSFAVLLWEIIEMKKPFEVYETNPFFFQDVIEGGKRPPIRSSLSKRLKKLMQKCWSEKISDRLCFGTIIEVLQEEIVDLRDRNAPCVNVNDKKRPSSSCLPGRQKRHDIMSQVISSNDGLMT